MSNGVFIAEGPRPEDALLASGVESPALPLESPSAEAAAAEASQVAEPPAVEEEVAIEAGEPEAVAAETQPEPPGGR